MNKPEITLNEIDLYKTMCNTLYGFSAGGQIMPVIKNVIFNDPATIVFWSDGTKTVVKCGDGDIFDPEKGLAMAIAKKALGNKGNYFNEIKHWTERCSEEDSAK